MNRRLPGNIEDEILRWYSEGRAPKEIAALVGTTDVTVGRVLRRRDVAIRPTPEMVTELWGSQADELIELYASGRTVKALARHFRCRDAAISRTLHRLGVPLKPGGRAALTEQQAQDVARRFDAGESMRALVRDVGVSGPTIQSAVRRYSQGRPVKLGTPKFWTPEKLGDAARRIQDGAPIRSVAESYGRSVQSLSAALRHAGHGVPLGPAKTGVAHHGWKGGRHVRDGYVKVKPTADDIARGLAPAGARYVFENRLVMARALGRPLTRSETVHHIDLNGLNNSLSNLQLRQGKHGTGAVVVCRTCGSNDLEFVQIADTGTS